MSRHQAPRPLRAGARPSTLWPRAARRPPQEERAAPSARSAVSRCGSSPRAPCGASGSRVWPRTSCFPAAAGAGPAPLAEDRWSCRPGRLRPIHLGLGPAAEITDRVAVALARRADRGRARARSAQIRLHQRAFGAHQDRALLVVRESQPRADLRGSISFARRIDGLGDGSQCRLGPARPAPRLLPPLHREAELRIDNRQFTRIRLLTGWTGLDYIALSSRDLRLPAVLNRGQHIWTRARPVRRCRSSAGAGHARCAHACRPPPRPRVRTR